MSFSQTCQRCALFTVKFMAWNSLTCLILHVISNKSAGFLISGSDILEKVYHNLSQFYQSARRDQGNFQQLSEVRGFHRPSIHFYSWKLCRRLVCWLISVCIPFNIISFSISSFVRGRWTAYSKFLIMCIY